MSLYRIARLLTIAAAVLPLTGCYLIQAAGGQMAIAAKREPIAEVLADASTPPELRTRLEYVAAARDFASRELGLPDNESYRSYADLGRPYVVWNVFAAPEFSVEPRRWCFPIAGCVVYRGYFNEAAAQRYARGLRRRGDDVAVGGVAAYSTLGHFKDPVLNTMLGWSDAQLAATLFHELAHQVVYVPGDSEFNESFATVVEEAGLERWLAARHRNQDLATWQEQRERQGQFIALLLKARDKLRTLYESVLPDDEKRSRKQYEFGELKLDYAQLRQQWHGYSGYDRWFDRTLTNAHLVSAATYYGCVPGLQRVLSESGGDLPRFYEAAKQLARLDKNARALAVCGPVSPPGIPAASDRAGS
ncbi:MAG TPA: aminopeptidase [Steroidobacteraceae bacterium]|jgi:predicted aminopeptidase|nr:aminopeptidase [Steroidobacteraceae bacterium]